MLNNFIIFIQQDTIRFKGTARRSRNSKSMAQKVAKGAILEYTCHAYYRAIKTNLKYNYERTPDV